MAESEEELKSLLMKVKKGEWKSWLNTQHSKNEDHGIRFHHFMTNRWQNNGNSERLFSWAPKSLWTVIAAMKLKYACSLEEKQWQTRQHIKKQRHYFSYKGLYSQSCGFSNSHVWMWELDHKDDWVPKNWRFRTVVLEKTLESTPEVIKVNITINGTNWRAQLDRCIVKTMDAKDA